MPTHVKEYFFAKGKQFDTRIEAERFEEFIEAFDNLRHARLRFAAAVAGMERTADGELFEVSVLRDFYFVSVDQRGWPSIGKISFCFWNIDVEREDCLVIVDESKGDCRKYPIKELYARYQNAELRKLELMKKAYRYLGEDLQELQTKLEGEQA